MASGRTIKVVGLTGGIASGKSTVARLLAARGVPVIDADQLSREVVEPGRPALAAIAARWPQVIDPATAALDRAQLAEQIFRDPGQRAALGAIMLPRIREALAHRLAALEAAGFRLCVFEAATLLEERLEHLVDGVLLVALEPELQVRRLVARTGMTAAQARLRLAAQLPLEAKRARARWVLDNRGSEAELEGALAALWPRVERELATP